MSQEVNERENGDVEQRDKRAQEIADRYTWAAGAAMVVIPIPGADMAATFAVWGKMISDLAEIYNQKVTFEDAKAHASEIFKSVILTTVAWFASAKMATGILKFIPGAGPIAGYLVDAVIAGFGAKKVTRTVALVASAYYKSGKKRQPETLLEQAKSILREPKLFLNLLGAIVPGFPSDESDIL